LAATDASLIRACLAGEIEAFGELVERYRNAVYGLCYARVGDFEQARDLAQDSFVSAYRALGQLREPERFPAWLRTIADNICKAALRRRQSPEESLEEKALPAAGDVAEEVSVRLAVQAALRSLPEDNRLVVSLFYVNGYTCDEIGEFLSVPASTVKGRLRAGRARLRRRLAPLVPELFREKALPPEFGGEVMQRIGKVELRRQHSAPVVVLSTEAGLELPIWIGETEATALWLELGEKTTPRPMTYDVFLEALSAFGVSVERVEVAEIRDTTYIASVALRRGGETKTLDARPSDAINIALRAKAPIFVSDSLASIVDGHPAMTAGMAEFQPKEAGPVVICTGHVLTRGSSWVAEGCEPILRVVRVILGAAVREQADLISIRPDRKRADAVSVHFRIGRERKERMSIPVYVLAPLRECLAEMAGVELRPGARRQTGTIHAVIEEQGRDFRVTFSPTAITIKPMPAAP